jgi:threonine dehydrogenase-like Zn-dependent dehydrogenase
MEIIKNKRVDLSPLITHHFPLNEIGEAYRIFGERRDGVMKVAITP